MLSRVVRVSWVPFPRPDPSFSEFHEIERPLIVLEQAHREAQRIILPLSMLTWLRVLADPRSLEILEHRSALTCVVAFRDAVPGRPLPDCLYLPTLIENHHKCWSCAALILTWPLFGSPVSATRPMICSRTHKPHRGSQEILKQRRAHAYVVAFRVVGLGKPLPDCIRPRDPR